MKNIIEKLRIYGLPTFLRYAISEAYYSGWMQLVRKSYSQHGEDLFIDELLGYKKKGFYIDVGAYDPHRFSNTKRFYKKGWKGINIEPDLINFKKFQNERKRDMNLNIGIGENRETLTFYRFVPDTLSTFSTPDAKEYKKQGFRLVNQVRVPVKRLETVIKTYASGKRVDFMSVDTEGYDLTVLKSNDWKRFRPKVICVEIAGHKGKKDMAIITYLQKQGYEKIASAGVNAIFLDRQ